MIRKIAWDAFKNTGDINAFLELKQIENLEKQLNNQIDIKEVQKNTNMNLEDFNRQQRWKNKHGKRKNEWSYIIRTQYGRF